MLMAFKLVMERRMEACNLSQDLYGYLACKSEQLGWLEPRSCHDQLRYHRVLWSHVIIRRQRQVTIFQKPDIHLGAAYLLADLDWE